MTKRHPLALFRWIAVAVSMALLATACAQDGEPKSVVLPPSDDVVVAEPTAVPEPTATPQAETLAVAPPRTLDVVDADLVAAFADQIDVATGEFLTCSTKPLIGLLATDSGVTKTRINIGFLEADLSTMATVGVVAPLEPEGEHFTAFADLLNSRCGGIYGRTIEVTTYTYDPTDPASTQDACIRATQEDENLLIVARVLTQEVPLCIVEANEQILVSLSAMPNEFFERSDGRLFSIGMEITRTVALQTQDLVNQGLLYPGRTVGLVWSESIDQNAIITDAIKPVLDAAGIDYVDAPVAAEGPACSGYNAAVQRLASLNVDIVLSPLGALCYPALVAEASALGYFPQWISTDFGAMNTLVGAQLSAVNGDAFTGAIGGGPVVSATGPITMGEPGPDWDGLCAFLVNSLVGSQWTYGSAEFSGIVEMCSAVYAITAGLANAGPDLTQTALIEGLERVDQIPLPNGVVGGFSSGRHFAPPDVMHTVEWNFDCACWHWIGGPRGVVLPTFDD